jgi:3-oxoacyl-[acyl-carrier-protein] synthase II
MELKRVVVTGLGAITPLGNSVQEYWKGLRNGVSGIDWITLFDTENFKTRFACEIKGYDPLDHFDRKELRKLDRYAQFAMLASEQALQDAGLNLESINRDRAGVIFGSGIGGLQTFQEEVRAFVSGNGMPRFSPFFIPKMIADIAAGHISMKYGLRGPNFGMVSACATSTNCLIDAANYIRLGKADLFVSGGSEASITEVGMGGFNAMMALSTNNEEYKTASRPFDVSRDGFVMGEGGGVLILEELEHARKRGAKIYAELIGTGMSADAYHLTAPHPEGIGAALVMKNALEDAGIPPEEVEYINVHGTATPLGDISEAKAIINVFGDHAFEMNISSTKSMTGHLLGAAGALESIAALMAIIEHVVPPTANLNNVDPEIDTRLNLTPIKAQEREVTTVLSNTFGFGGHNASVIFRKYTE